MKKILNSYDLLLDRKIEIEIKNTSYYIDFSYFNLPHLIGIQYLKDMPSITRIDKKKFASKIRKGNIDYELIASSSFFYRIQDRLENFYYLSNFVLAKQYVEFASFKCAFPSTKLKCDYFLIHRCVKDDQLCVFLGLTIDVTNDQRLIPVSYFIKRKAGINNLKKKDILKISSSKF